MNKVYLFAFTRSEDPHEPSTFCSLLAQFLPTTLPECFFQGEDETTPFGDVLTDQEVARQFAGFWWNRRVSWERSKPGVSGTAALGRATQHTAIRHTFDEDLADGKACRAFLTEMAVRLKVALAYFHLVPAGGRFANRHDKMLGGATPLNIQDNLPGVPWAIWYGPPYVELFGKKTLLTAPVHETTAIQPDVVYCQLTADFSDVAEKPELVSARQAAVRDYLGRDAFYDPEMLHHPGKVPQFARPIVNRPNPERMRSPTNG